MVARLPGSSKTIVSKRACFRQACTPAPLSQLLIDRALTLGRGVHKDVTCHDANASAGEHAYTTALITQERLIEVPRFSRPQQSALLYIPCASKPVLLAYQNQVYNLYK